MMWSILAALVLLLPAAQAAPIRVLVYTEPDQPAGTTDVAVWLAPGVPATITTEPPRTSLPPVTGGTCALTGEGLSCIATADMLILRVSLPLRRVDVTQGAACGEWPTQRACGAQPPPVWPETTVRIGDSPYDGYRRLTIDAAGTGGVGYIVIPQDSSASALDALAHGSASVVCKRLVWYDTFTHDVQAVWIACGVQLESGGSGQAVIDLPRAITYIDLVEEVSGVQRATRWLLDSGAPASVLALPMVGT